MKGIKEIMKTIGKKRPAKVTKEATAKKLYESLTIEQKNELYSLLGKIACGEVKNFYSTRAFKSITKDMKGDVRNLVSYICRKVSLLNVFENMEDLTLTEE